MYGVISYLVNQRTREIGIRIELGATPMSVLQFVVGQSIRITVAGLAVGILLAVAASKLLASGLAGINWFDLAAYTAGPLMVMLAGILAALGPAGRAARVNPADTLAQNDAAPAIALLQHRSCRSRSGSARCLNAGARFPECGG